MYFFTKKNVYFDKKLSKDRYLEINLRHMPLSLLTRSALTICEKFHKSGRRPRFLGNPPRHMCLEVPKKISPYAITDRKTVLPTRGRPGAVSQD